jgi:hypothetical protein
MVVDHVANMLFVRYSRLNCAHRCNDSVNPTTQNSLGDAPKPHMETSNDLINPILFFIFCRVCCPIIEPIELSVLLFLTQNRVISILISAQHLCLNNLGWTERSA